MSEMKEHMARCAHGPARCVPCLVEEVSELREKVAQWRGVTRQQDRDIEALRAQLAQWRAVTGFDSAELFTLRHTRWCKGCNHLLRSENHPIADGCPCNSPRGVNHGQVPSTVCTCDVCDPERTGSSRWPAPPAVKP